MSLRVMIVEDEPLIAMAMQMLVEDAGWEALGPHGAVAPALAMVGSGEAISVALLDCNLGKDTSWLIADALAARGIPFAFTSGQGLKDIAERFAGRPVFAKPVEEEKLKRFLRQFAQQT